MRLLILSILVTVLFVSTISAYNGNANISSEIYSFESDNTKHYQFYQSLQSRMSLYQLGEKRISFSTYGRWRTDLKSQQELGSKLFIYDFQVNFKNFVNGSKFSLGRQYVYSSVGSALVDGLSIKSTLIQNSEISFNVGSEVNRLQPDKIQNLTDNLITGLRYTYRFDKNLSLGLNWFLRKNESQTTTNKIGLDVRKKINSLSLYSRMTYNITMRSLNELLFRGSYRINKWYLSVEGRSREPLVSSNSIFAIIDSDKHKRVRVNVQYKLNKKTRLISNLNYVLYEDENIIRGTIGVRYSQFSFFYNFQNGRGNESNGVSGTMSHRLNQSTSLYASVNLSKYKIQDSYDLLSEAYSTAIGAVRKLPGSWQIRGEWQYLRNAVESSNSRIYLKLGKRLSF